MYVHGEFSNLGESAFLAVSDEMTWDATRHGTPDIFRAAFFRSFVHQLTLRLIRGEGSDVELVALVLRTQSVAERDTEGRRTTRVRQ